MSAIKKILVPTDFSEASRESLRYACTLADALSASLHIIHVNQSPYLPGGSLDFYTLPPDFFQEIERAASSDLAALLTKEEMVKVPGDARAADRGGGARDTRVPPSAGGHRHRGHGHTRARRGCAADDGERGGQGHTWGPVPRFDYPC